MNGRRARNIVWTVDSAAVHDIYGLDNEPLTHEFTTKKSDDYSTVSFTITGLDGRPAIVEVLNTSDKPAGYAPVEGNIATIAYLPPGTYYARLYIDANGDGNGTGWDSPEWLYDEQYGCALYYGKRDVVADDWLITPSLEMDPSSVYKLTFKYYAYYGFGSKFRVAIGSSPEVEAMDNQILYKETVSSFADRPGITETVYFSPERATRS